MNYNKEKVGKSNFILHASTENNVISTHEILESWKNNNFNFPKSQSNTDVGFRSAQLGALYAIKSHWTLSSSAATIVMPTGTGKTEVMIATVVSEHCSKTCIIVPSKLLRKQTVLRFCTLGKLQEIGAISESFRHPMIGCLVSSPQNIDEFKSLIEKSNVIVTTMTLLSSNYFKDEFLELLVAACDTLIIDEAHHVPAKSWSKLKKTFEAIRCLQFTATPFRNDGKKIDGDIIYNFPLTLAQKQGYFKPINFYPLYEFDNDRKDLSIAMKAIELLEADIKKNHPHLLLVRTATQKRAKNLFNNIYNKYFAKHSPVLIISDNSAIDNNKAIQSINNGLSKIIVCVDMFSEGIDIPRLKICAIHDKYKSLPITMQFIGRFARNQTDLGEASVVANVVDDDIQESLDELYSQDADWNILLKNLSDAKIKREVDLQKLARGFTGTEVIPINQIKPKVSMFMYTTKEKRWHWQNWNTVFNAEHCHHFINTQEKILIITEHCIDNVDWTTCKDITNSNWNLHILYWNKEKNVFFISTTNKSIANRFAESIFNNYKRISGEQVFRCLYGINRLMLSTVGLKTAISTHHIRYRMFAGIDIADGITGAIKGSAIKSNLFGIGYENGHDISIGCSYKGTIWARWVEDINFWKEWCNKQAEKILNQSINTTDILKGALVSEEIKVRPAIVPYRIDFPVAIEEDWNGSINMMTPLSDSNSNFMNIGLLTFNETSTLNFFVGNNTFQEIFSLNITGTGYSISHKKGSNITIQLSRNKKMSLSNFFQENPPIIWFVDGSSLEGNFIVKSKSARPIKFSQKNIIVWNWSGTDIKKESQGSTKMVDSIQYKLISELKSSGKYCLIFDDDGSGEIADVIAIQEDTINKKLLFELYHCKYSGEAHAGARVGDLYEVCGQTEKSIKWASNPKNIFDRLMKREHDRSNNNKSTRYELGNDPLLFTLKKKLKFYSSTFKVYIVQPGVNHSQITDAMHQVLCSSEAYLQDTYAIPLTLICS